MKKRLMKSAICAMAVLGMLFSGGELMTARAEEASVIIEGDVTREDGCRELCVGDYPTHSISVYDEDGVPLEYGEDWDWVDNDTCVELGFKTQYSESSDFEKSYEDPNLGVFGYDEVIPVEAFGKYIWKYVVIDWYDSEGGLNMQFKALRSEYTVHDWGDTDYQTFSLNGDGKTVSVFTIHNADNPFDADFQKSIKVGEKKYKVTGIGDYALENDAGTGMRSVTIHSGIKTIGKCAFMDAENLKTITIEGKPRKIGKNAFRGIHKKAVFKIKASEKDYKKIVKLIKKSGVAKTVSFKKI